MSIAQRDEPRPSITMRKTTSGSHRSMPQHTLPLHTLPSSRSQRSSLRTLPSSRNQRSSLCTLPSSRSQRSKPQHTLLASRNLRSKPQHTLPYQHSTHHSTLRSSAGCSMIRKQQQRTSRTMKKTSSYNYKFINGNTFVPTNIQKISKKMQKLDIFFVTHHKICANNATKRGR